MVRADTMSAPRIPWTVRQRFRRAGRFCLEVRLACVPGELGRNGKAGVPEPMTEEPGWRRSPQGRTQAGAPAEAGVSVVGVGTEAAAVAPPKSWFSSPHSILPCGGMPRRGGVEGRRTCGGGSGPPRSSSERRTGDVADVFCGHGARGRRALRRLGHLPTIRVGQSSDLTQARRKNMLFRVCRRSHRPRSGFCRCLVEFMSGDV